MLVLSDTVYDSIGTGVTMKGMLLFGKTGTIGCLFTQREAFFNLCI